MTASRLLVSLGLCCLLTLLSACRHTARRVGSVPGDRPRDALATSAPLQQTDPTVDGAEKGPGEKLARLKPGLMVQVTVVVLGKKEIEELNRRVADEGTLVLPLLGTVKVEGMTPSELSADLTKRYARFFVDPHVVVDFVTERGTDAPSPWGYVTVLGCVKNPGRVSIPATQDLTVSAAIQQAGGLKPSGKDSAIEVRRQGAAGKAEVIAVNLRAAGTRAEKREDPVLQSQDVVFVPEMIF